MSSADAETLFETLLAQQQDRTLPPVAQWQPERKGVIDIRIKRDGSWIHEGGLIRREAMVRLFASILRVEDGQHYLVTPVEKLAIEVEECPFTAVHLERDGAGADQRLLLTTNVGEHILVNAEHPLRLNAKGNDARPVVEVRNGLDALVSRPVYYEITALAVADPRDPTRLGVHSCGTFFELGRLHAA